MTVARPLLGVLGGAALLWGGWRLLTASDPPPPPPPEVTAMCHEQAAVELGDDVTWPDGETGTAEHDATRREWHYRNRVRVGGGAPRTLACTVHDDGRRVTITRFEVR